MVDTGWNIAAYWSLAMFHRCTEWSLGDLEQPIAVLATFGSWDHPGPTTSWADQQEHQRRTTCAIDQVHQGSKSWQQRTSH